MRALVALCGIIVPISLPARVCWAAPDVIVSDQVDPAPAQPMPDDGDEIAPPPRPIPKPSSPATPSEAGRPSVRPTQPAIRPVQPAIRPIEPAVRSLEPAVRPIEPVVRPIEPAVRPIEPAVRPVTPPVRPVPSGEGPMQPAALRGGAAGTSSQGSGAASGDAASSGGVGGSAMASSGMSGSATVSDASPRGIETAALRGVRPGASTVEELTARWGAPRQTSENQGVVRFEYAMEGLGQVEAYARGGTVAYVLLSFREALPPELVARQLQFESLEPVIVTDEAGAALGWAYPERGVALSFDPQSSTPRVAQLLIEPVGGEAFALRAETRWRRRPQAALDDCEVALRLDPRHDRALWTKARVLAMVGRCDEAVQAIEQAIALAPSRWDYRVTRGEVLTASGEHAQAVRQISAVLESPQVPPHIRALAMCRMAELTAAGPGQKLREAVAMHTEAIRIAEPLARHRLAEMRRTARMVLVESHMGVAVAIAWGEWNRKDEALGRWISRAVESAEHMIRDGEAGEELRLVIMRRALAAYAGMQGQIDGEPMSRSAEMVARRLVEGTSDPLFHGLVEREVAEALYDAMRCAHARGDARQALAHGQSAAAYFARAAARQTGPWDEQWQARVFFRIGAVHAVLAEDHRQAVAWYERAASMLERPCPSSLFDPAEQAEAWISMGVSYWALQDRQRAVDATNEGVAVLERAVREGYARPAQLEVPYNNLAAMHKDMGQLEQSRRYLELAERVRASEPTSRQ